MCAADAGLRPPGDAQLALIRSDAALVTARPVALTAAFERPFGRPNLSLRGLWGTVTSLLYQP